MYGANKTKQVHPVYYKLKVRRSKWSGYIIHRILVFIDQWSNICVFHYSCDSSVHWSDHLLDLDCIHHLVLIPSNIVYYQGEQR